MRALVEWQKSSLYWIPSNQRFRIPHRLFIKIIAFSLVYIYHPTDPWLGPELFPWSVFTRPSETDLGAEVGC